MKVSDLTRSALRFRREERELQKRGYRRHETDWEIHRGYASTKGYRILDAKVSCDGMYVYTRIGAAETA